MAYHTDAALAITGLARGAGLSQPTISHHMKVLHEAGLVDRDKRGVWVYYRIRPQALASCLLNGHFTRYPTELGRSHASLRSSRR